MENNETFGFNTFQSELDEHLTKFIHNLPNDLIEHIKQKVFKSRAFFLRETSFQLELIADTNIIFSEVRSLMVNKSSFFMKIIDNPLIKVYAPSKLKDELIEKIKIKFPKDKKTRNLDINESLEKAELILSKIEIRDDISESAHKKAYTLLNDRDPDDIIFVALNIDLNSHGILTKDRDIKDNDNIKTWGMGDAGKMITEINKGSFSFVIMNDSIEMIFKTILDIIKVIWSGIITIINGFIKLFTSILTGSFKMISNMPPELSMILGVALVSILLTNELRKGVGNFLAMLWEQIKKVIIVLKEFFIEIWETFKEIMIALKPLLEVSGEVFEYLSIQSDNAIYQLEKLESERAD